MAKARGGQQSGMIVVDRTIKGKNENYQTPERSIPDHQINHPWESCITLSHSWAWALGAKYKTYNQVANILAEIAAKGGYLLLVSFTDHPQRTSEADRGMDFVDAKGNVAKGYGMYAAVSYDEGKTWPVK